MRFKFLIFCFAMLSMTNVRGQELHTLILQGSVDTGDYFVLTHDASGSWSTQRVSITSLATYINSQAITGVPYNMPVFYSGHVLGSSAFADSIGVNHSYIYDTCTVLGQLRLKNVPPAAYADSPLVMGANQHTVRAVHPPVSDGTINVIWPSDSFNVNHNKVPLWSDTGGTPELVTPAYMAAHPPAPGGSAGGDLTGSYPNPTLHTSGMVAGTYGSASVMPVYTVDAKGRITTFSTVNIVPTNAAGGGLAGAYPNPNLAATTVTAGSYGSGAAVGTFTVNSSGQLTAAANVAIKPDTINGTPVSPGGNIVVTAQPSAPYSPQNMTVTVNPTSYAIASAYGSTMAPVNVYVSGQTNNLTFGAVTGTWVTNQFLMIVINTGSTSVSLAWNSVFVAGTTTNGGALPTVSVANKEETLVFRYTLGGTLAFVGYSVN